MFVYTGYMNLYIKIDINGSYISVYTTFLNTQYPTNTPKLDSVSKIYLENYPLFRCSAFKYEIVCAN